MKQKKYGVIYVKTLPWPKINIGDDIQTLAAINFLKSKGIHKYEFVNRERLSDYDGDEINLVMNGWFMYNFNKFPPSKKIKPIWISFHVWFEKLIQQHKEYFKTQPPIGCRDQATVDLFKKHGIDAYFTGCLTLTFDKYVKKGDKKYLVDINTKCKYIPDFDMNMKQFRDFKIVEHDRFKKGYSDIEKRMQLANEFIDNYKKASLVVTSRLHCALPCRAFGTDCIFMHKGYESDPRFKGLKGVLNGAAEYHSNTSPVKGELKKIQKFFKSYKI